MDKFYYGTRTIMGVSGIVLAIILGSILSFGAEGTLLLVVVFYFFGISVGPRILFELAKPYLKIYLVAGPVGIAFIHLAIKLFRVDGKLLPEELKKLREYMAIEFGTELGEVTEIYLNSEPVVEGSIYSICHSLLKMKLSHRIIFLQQLFKMIASDGHCSDEEEMTLRKIARFLHIGKKRYDLIKSSILKEDKKGTTEQNRSYSTNAGYGYKFFQQFFAPVYNPFIILGLENSATNEEIKKAYRSLVKKYHPDVSMQKSEQYRKLVIEKIQEVNEAYDVIKKIRGIK